MIGHLQEIEPGEPVGLLCNAKRSWQIMNADSFDVTLAKFEKFLLTNCDPTVAESHLLTCELYTVIMQTRPS